MDKVEEALQQMGGRVLAFEHDGLFVYAPCGKEELLERAQAAAGYPLTVKACAEYTTDEAWETIFEKSGDAKQWGVRIRLERRAAQATAARKTLSKPLRRITNGKCATPIGAKQKRWLGKLQ